MMSLEQLKDMLDAISNQEVVRFSLTLADGTTVSVNGAAASSIDDEFSN
jgi:hypothetical protein